MKKFLLIAYAYPPISSPGAVRGTRMLRYLKAFGYHGSVLTVDKGYSSRIGGLEDPLNNDPKYVFRIGDPVARINASIIPKHEVSSVSNEMKGKLKGVLKSALFPDRSILWTLKARTWMSENTENFQFVYSTSPTASTHIVGYRLSRKMKVPWVAEFRDPLSWLDSKNSASKFRRWGLKRYEKWVVKNAAAIVVVSDTFKDYFETLYPNANIVAIPNGAEFKIEDLKTVIKTRTSRHKNRTMPIRLVHTGSFYGGARPPGPLIRACKLAEEKSNLKFNFLCAGNDVNLAVEAAEKIGCPEIVKDMGVLPHDETLELLGSADANISLLMDEELARISIPSKFLDYLPAGAPILNLGSSDFVLSRIINDQGAGASFEFDDIDGIANWLVNLPNIKQPDTITLCQDWSADKMAERMTSLFGEL